MTALRLAGYSPTAVARFLGISKATLQKHFRRELQAAVIEANIRVTQAMLKKAVEGHVPACIWWLERQCPAFMPPEKDAEGSLENMPVPVTIDLPESQWGEVADGGPLMPGKSPPEAH